jgi:UDP-glucose 4-epimerase
LVLQAWTSGERPQIFGNNYPTRDGTGIRDYIHVADLAEAHVTAAARVESDDPGFVVYNIGRGSGSSVREVIAAVPRAVGAHVTRSSSDVVRAIQRRWLDAPTSRRPSATGSRTATATTWWLAPGPRGRRSRRDSRSAGA